VHVLFTEIQNGNLKSTRCHNEVTMALRQQIYHKNASFQGSR